MNAYRSGNTLTAPDISEANEPRTNWPLIVNTKVRTMADVRKLEKRVRWHILEHDQKLRRIPNCPFCEASR